jgi:hypothetical protein
VFLFYLFSKNNPEIGDFSIPKLFLMMFFLLVLEVVVWPSTLAGYWDEIINKKKDWLTR